MGTKTWVLLNSERVVNEIMAKRAAITHERPHFPIAGTLVSRNKRQFLQKTQDWREGRKLIHGLIMGADSKAHGAVVEEVSLCLLTSYLDSPRTWYVHNYDYCIRIMHKLVFNQPANKSQSNLEELQRVTSSFLTSINTSFVEFFPILEKTPRFLQFWRAHWENMGLYHCQVFKKWWAAVQDMRDPEAEPSFMRDKVCNTFSGDEEKSMYLAMLSIVAGADNPRMTMNTWVMAYLAYPETMQRVRDEIDAVCGGDLTSLRLPTLDDMKSLPLTCATVKEVLRWRPPIPLVPQRVLTEDMEFEGYSFPAGTEFLINSISVCTNMCKDSDVFRPERWLETEGGLSPDLWQFAFSAGRRSCVGYKLAQKELFVAFARLLYCFNFEAAGEIDNHQLNPFRPGEPFPTKVVVRSAAHEKLIREQEMCTL